MRRPTIRRNEALEKSGNPSLQFEGRVSLSRFEGFAQRRGRGLLKVSNNVIDIVVHIRLQVRLIAKKTDLAVAGHLSDYRRAERGLRTHAIVTVRGNCDDFTTARSVRA